MASQVIPNPLSLDAPPERGAVPARARPLTDVERRSMAAFDRTFRRASCEASNTQAFLSPMLHSGQDVVTDLSFGIRVLPDHAVLDSTMGESTVLNSVLGYNAYLGATKNAEHAHFVGSETEERVATLDRVRCVTNLVNGGLYFGVRNTGLASAITGTNASMQAPTLLGRVTYVLSSLGAAISGVGYLLLGALKTMQIYNAYKFRRELEAASRDDATLLAFIGLHKGDRQAGVLDREYTDEQLGQEAISSTAELLRMRLQEAGYEEFRAEEREEFVSALFKLGNVNPVELGTEWKIEKERAKYKLELSSFVGSLDLDAEESVQVKKAKILAAMDKKFWTNAGYLAASILGIAMTITAFAATGGAAAILVAVGFLIVALTMMGLDGYDFYHKLSSPVEVAQFDRTMLKISTVMAAVSTLVAIVLLSVFSAGAGPLVAAIIIGLFWLSMNGFIWWKLPSNQVEAADSARRLREQRERREELRELLMPVLTNYFSPAFIEELLPAPQEPRALPAPAPRRDVDPLDDDEPPVSNDMAALYAGLQAPR